MKKFSNEYMGMLAIVTVSPRAAKKASRKY